MKKFWKVLAVLFASAVLIFAVLARMTIHWMCTTEVKMVGKTHFDFVVSKGQIVDYRSFLDPAADEETEPLEQIDGKARREIAAFMKSHNLKLKEGHHYFNRVDGTAEEYLNNNFKFERMK